jgi:TRAP-type C4-dicarboxylate transport system substrate-binding protein
MLDRADLCWAGTRAFGCLGVRSLDPLQTPLLFSDYEGVDAVCRDAVAREMLEPLERLGLVGLVVLPGAFRKPFSFARRLVSARDWVGARMRIHESVVAERTYEALGARAVVLSMRQMGAGAAAYVDGLDIQTQALVPWGLRGSLTYDVDLWPRTVAIVASARAARWLGADERAVLETAAARTLDRALAFLADQRERDRELLPPTVTPVYAGEERVKELRDRVEPVYRELREHPETGSFLARIEAIAARG